MKLAKFVTFFFCSISIASASFANTAKISLKEFLNEVESNSSVIQSAQFRSEALKHRIGPSSSLEDPFIAVGLDEIPFEGEGSKVKRYQISQNIPFPGKRSLKQKIAESRYEAYTSSVETIKRQSRIIGTQLFLKAQYNEFSIHSYEQIKSIIEGLTASVKAKYRTGENNHHEWIQAKIELSTLNVELLRLNRLQANLKALMNELRNKSPETSFDIVAENFHFSNNESEVIDLETQPEIQVLKSELLSNESELKLAKLSYTPDFVFQGMAMEPAKMDPDSMEKSNWGFMVGFTIPLFFWNKQNELVSAAEKDRQAVNAELNVLRNRINTEFLLARKQLETSFDVLNLYKNDVIPLSEIAVKNAKVAYTSNRMTLRQYLDSLKVERIQKLEYLGAQMDVVVSKMRIKDILSNPPITRFAPARPFTFEANMGSSMSELESMEGSDSINTGSGINIPKKSNASDSNSSSSGMGGM